MAIKIDHQQNLILTHDNELNFDPVIDIVNNTASTNPTSGALKVAGGVGVQGNVNVGGDMSVGGTVTMTGNFQVTGTSTNLVNTTINQALIKLGEGVTTQSNDQGFVVTRGDGVSTNTDNVAAFWDESADEFVLASTPTEDGNTNGNVTIVDYAPFHIGGLIVEDNLQVLTNASITGTLNVSNTSTVQNMTVAGNLTVEGDTITNNTSGSTTVNGSLAVTGQSTLSSLAVSDLTGGRIALTGNLGELITSSEFSFDATAGVVAVDTNGAFRIPSGTTAQRPTVTPLQGQIRYNTDIGRAELYGSNGWTAFSPITELKGLSDTPAAYVGSAGKLLRVDTGATGVEFSDVLPPLGANLDLNGKEIGGTGTINYTGNFHATIADDTASPSPLFVLNRTSTSPAAADNLGQLEFHGNNSATTLVPYSKVTGVIDDPTATAEDGAIHFTVRKAGTETKVAEINKTGITLVNANVIFEGATDNNIVTTITATDPTSNRTITLKDASGTVAFTSDIPSDTDGLAEGSTNKYFNGKTTDDLPEGSTNKYYADSLVSTGLGLGTIALNIVKDLTPQLGGDLDVNGNIIKNDVPGGLLRLETVANGDIQITPNGSGKVVIDGLNYPTSDGSSGQFLKTDGAGNLSFGATEIQTDTNPFLGGNLNLNDNNILVTTNNTSNIGHANNQLATVFTNNIHMHNAYHSHASTATSSSTTEFAADSFAIATYRSAEYFISAQDASANKFHTEKIMVLHDGTDNFMTTFATLISDNTLFTVTSDINSGNVRLLLTPTTSNSLTYRFIAEKHLI
mgnify:FL=1